MPKTFDRPTAVVLGLMVLGCIVIVLSGLVHPEAPFHFWVKAAGLSLMVAAVATMFYYIATHNAREERKNRLFYIRLFAGR